MPCQRYIGNGIHFEKAGYPVVDFSGHEYDKYFLKDTIHLGWKGWIYFDEAVQNFYTEK